MAGYFRPCRRHRIAGAPVAARHHPRPFPGAERDRRAEGGEAAPDSHDLRNPRLRGGWGGRHRNRNGGQPPSSEEPTPELQSQMRTSYDVSSLIKKTTSTVTTNTSESKA